MIKCVVLALLAVSVTAAHGLNRFKPATSPEGWHLLGKYCFGYAKDSQEVGRIDLQINNPNRIAGAAQFSNLTVLIYDSEPSSWPALRFDMTCEQKLKMAKDAFKVDQFTVNFDINNQWQMPHVPITETYTPLEWYVVLARCNSAVNEQAFDVDYDLHWTGSGIYDNEMGPLQCIDNGATGSSTKTALTVIDILLAVVVIFLSFFVFQQRKSIMNGRGHKISDHDDGGR